ncbi:hypothetical protein FKM82_028081 [Ascaphus truei]
MEPHYMFPFTPGKPQQICVFAALTQCVRTCYFLLTFCHIQRYPRLVCSLICLGSMPGLCFSVSCALLGDDILSVGL